MRKIEIKVATFRTECEGDCERVPALLKALGLSLVNNKVVGDVNASFWKMGVYTIEIPTNKSVASVQKRMAKLILSSYRFVDMHRCFETLQKGEEPNEEWFMNDNVSKIYKTT